MHVATRLAAGLIVLGFTAAAGTAGAVTLTLENTFGLSGTLAAPASNYHPQGLGYDTGSDELLFMQQATNTIYRADLTGTITGSRTIGAITYNPFGAVSGTANHTTSVAGDGTSYYFSDYTNNSGGYDVYGIGKSGGAAASISTEIAAFGGYPIDVRDGKLYRTQPSTTYSYAGLNQIRISDLSTPDTIDSAVTLAAGAGIADIAVDSARGNVWILDYGAAASLRRFDLATGAELDSFALGLDGLDAGITYANDKLYYYDWRSGSGSTLTVYALDGFGDAQVSEPAALAMLCLGLGALARLRRRPA